MVITGSLVGIIITIILLSSIGPLVVQLPFEQEDTNNDDTNDIGRNTTLSIVVSWLCAVGLLISSLLNGFGSVSLPFTYLSGIFMKQVRPETINKLTSELRSMQDTVSKKRIMVKELTVEVSGVVSSSSTSTSITTSSSSSSSGLALGGGGRSSITSSSSSTNPTVVFDDAK